MPDGLRSPQRPGAPQSPSHAPPSSSWRLKGLLLSRTSSPGSSRDSSLTASPIESSRRRWGFGSPGARRRQAAASGHTVHGASNFANVPSRPSPASRRQLLSLFSIPSLSRSNSRSNLSNSRSNTPSAARRRSSGDTTPDSSVHSSSTLAEPAVQERSRSFWPMSGSSGDDVADLSSPSTKSRRRRQAASKSVHGSSSRFIFASLFAVREQDDTPRPVVSEAPREAPRSPALPPPPPPPGQPQPAQEQQLEPSYAGAPTFVVNPRSFIVEEGDEPDAGERLRHVGRLLYQICALNGDGISAGGAALSPFDAVERLPRIPIDEFLLRIRRCVKFSFVCFGIGLTYIDQLLKRSREHADATGVRSSISCLTFRNVHRLLVTAIHLASKAADDVNHHNSFIALVAGLERRELNALETQLCARLQWRLKPEPDELEALTAALDDDPLALGSGWGAWLRPAREIAPGDDFPSSPRARPQALVVAC